MVETCCVPLCRQRGYRDENSKKVTFHKFPSGNKLRRKWIHAIRRDPGAHFSIQQTTKVCSRHFTPDSFVPNVASGRQYLKENAVPSLFEFTKKVVPRPVPNRQPLQTKFLERNSTDVFCSDEMASPPDLNDVGTSTSQVPGWAVNTDAPASISLTQGKCNCACTEELTQMKLQLKEKDAELVKLKDQCNILLNCSNILSTTKRDLARAKEQVVCLMRRNEELKNEHTAKMQELERKLSEADKRKKTFSAERFKDDDSSIQFYTGLQSYGHFKGLLQYVASESDGANPDHPSREARGRRHKLSQEDQLFMTLVKLRLGHFHMHLAHIFNVSTSTVSRAFGTWVNLLYVRLSELAWWPPRDIVDSTMPEEFKARYPTTRVIIDATEVRCEVSSSLVLQSGTYSPYKSTNTLKGLIGISPNGLVSFVSELFTGSASDRELVIRSGFLEQEFAPGDTVMADKGFKIKDLLDKKGIGLNLPPFLTKQQFSVAEVRETADIASLRIHVERRIQRIKTYHIFDRVVPLSLGPIVNQMWTICALLSNLQPSILKEVD
ncbi:uncharacterized protein ISCGN_031567 [Ixodes scapularis]